MSPRINFALFVCFFKILQNKSCHKQILNSTFSSQICDIILNEEEIDIDIDIRIQCASSL